MPINFVTFLVEPVVKSASANVWNLLSGQDQLRLLKLSARVHHPDAQFTILTDQATTIPQMCDDDEIVRRSIDQSEIMLERTRQQYNYLLNYDFQHPMIFIDTDILLLKNIDVVFLQDFDIGLTIRDNKEMPVNGGVIFVNNRNPQSARHFFKTLLGIIESQGKQERNWYGDQLALCRMVSSEPEKPIQADSIFEANGVRLLCLPGAKFNFSAQRGHPNLFQNLDKISIYHFKGRSRIYMKTFWDYRVNPARAKSGKLFACLVFKALYLEIQRWIAKKYIRSDSRRVMRTQSTKE